MFMVKGEKEKFEAVEALRKDQFPAFRNTMEEAQGYKE
jgi:hypothetical protein